MGLGVVHGRRRRVVNRRDRSRRWIIHGRKRGLVIWAGEGRGLGWLVNNRGRRLRIDYNRTRGSGICDGSLDKIKNALIFGKESHARSNRRRSVQPSCCIIAHLPVHPPAVRYDGGGDEGRPSYNNCPVVKNVFPEWHEYSNGHAFHFPFELS